MADTKKQWQKAQALIKQKRYNQARKILVRIDHPQARDWLARLDKMAPPPKGGVSRGRGCLGYLVSVLVSALVTTGLIAVLVLATQSTWQGEQAAADTRPISTPVSTAISTAPDGTSPTTAPVEATTAATEVIVETCAEGEAQAWWNDQRELYYQARFVLMQYDENGLTDYETLAPVFASAVTNFYDTNGGGIPACLQDTYTSLQDAYNFTYGIMDAYTNGNANTITDWFDTARARLDSVADALAAEGVTVDMTDCGAEYWLAGLAPTIIELDTVLGNVEAGMESGQARSALFALRDVSRTVEAVYTPDCASEAGEALVNTTRGAVELVRAIGNNDESNRQRFQTEVSGSFASLTAAVQRLGLPFPTS